MVSEIHWEVIKEKYNEGLKIKKVPWCCCGYHENIVRYSLNYIGIYEEEGYKGTLVRYNKEGRYSKKEWSKAEKELENMVD